MEYILEGLMPAHHFVEFPGAEQMSYQHGNKESTETITGLKTIQNIKKNIYIFFFPHKIQNHIQYFRHILFPASCVCFHLIFFFSDSCNLMEESMTHLQAFQISMKFLLQLASEIGIV